MTEVDVVSSFVCEWVNTKQSRHPLIDVIWTKTQSSTMCQPTAKNMVYTSQADRYCSEPHLHGGLLQIALLIKA
jgi:hypothetical protein